MGTLNILTMFRIYAIYVDKEFTLQKGIQVIIGTGDGEYELSQKPEHDNSKK